MNYLRPDEALPGGRRLILARICGSLIVPEHYQALEPHAIRSSYSSVVNSGSLIREARLKAGLTQEELGALVGRDRSHIARWERDAVEPGLSTVREVLRACGYDLSMALIPYNPGPKEALKPLQGLTPSERLDRMLRADEGEI